MLDIQQYPIRDPDSAAQFLQQAMEGRESLFLQVDAAAKAMQLSKEPSRFLYARYGLMEYMSAAYATRNREAFDAAVGSMMTHPLPEASNWFAPTAAQLGGDLAVALSCQRVDRISDIATQVLRTAAGDAASPEDMQAHVLALLTDLDYRQAADAVQRMRKAILAANLTMHEAAVLSAWASVAEDVAARSDLALDANLQTLSRQRCTYVDKMLARWRKGQNTDLSAIDFWDSQATALVVIASSMGLAISAGPADLAFSNWRWTAEAHVWA